MTCTWLIVLGALLSGILGAAIHHVLHIPHCMDAEEKADDLLMEAWGIIANAGGGDWGRETPEWRTAATRWRDHWLRGEPR